MFTRTQKNLETACDQSFHEVSRIVWHLYQPGICLEIVKIA
jgi:hypothetical protein